MMLNNISNKIAKITDVTFTQAKVVAKLLLAMTVAFFIGAVFSIIVVGCIKYKTYEKHFTADIESKLIGIVRGDADSILIGKVVIQRTGKKSIEVSIIDKLSIAGAGDDTKQKRSR